MIRMSVTCPHAKRAGYTLVELLMVMVLLGLLAGLVIPRLGAWLTSVQIAYQRDEVLRQLSGLGSRAYYENREWILSEWPLVDQARDTASEKMIPLELPPDWRLKAKPPLRYYQSGMCAGGKISLETPHGIWLFKLRPPYCRPELA